jgi:hypothetical protein
VCRLVDTESGGCERRAVGADRDDASVGPGVHDHLEVAGVDVRGRGIERELGRVPSARRSSTEATSLETRPAYTVIGPTVGSESFAKPAIAKVASGAVSGVCRQKVIPPYSP